LYYRFALGATSLLMLCTPLLALANPFSIASLLAGFGARADAASHDTPNSQRMALLSPATNIDPNPYKGGNNLSIEGAALAASVGPAGVVSDVEELPASSAISVHTVRDGETLSELAVMYGVTINTILWANDIKNGVIHPGQQLVILPVTGIRHTVALGESLQTLAKKYNGEAGDIALYNGLAAGSALAAGQTVIIPNGQIPSTPKPVAKKPAAAKPGATKPSSGSPRIIGGGGPVIGGFAWPVAGGQLTQSLHGWNGVDIGAPRGTSIMASAGGTVIVARAGGYNGGYGSYVVISHPNGTQTLYAHMSKVSVSPGQSVAQGTVIGAVGNSGRSTGTHLHFEVRGAQNPFSN
jgi:LysM repeat protein